MVNSLLCTISKLGRSKFCCLSRSQVMRALRTHAGLLEDTSPDAEQFAAPRTPDYGATPADKR